MTDHSEYLKQFISKGTVVYACQEVWNKFSELTAYKRYKRLIDGSQFKVGTFIVKPFKVPHTNSDGSPCENYGFLLYSTVTKEKMMWVTDCAYIEQKFPVLDYICIECNYVDVESYAEELEHINQITEKRRFNSHLSLNRCIEFLKHQDLSKVKFVKLLHLTRSQGIIEDEIKERFKQEFPEIEVRI